MFFSEPMLKSRYKADNLNEGQCRTCRRVSRMPAEIYRLSV